MSTCPPCLTRRCAGPGRGGALPPFASARAVQRSWDLDKAQIPVCTLRKLCEPDDAGERTLEMDVRRMGLSARVHDRLLIVSRTVADLSGSAALAAELVAEAAQFRSLDRNYWS